MAPLVFSSPSPILRKWRPKYCKNPKHDVLKRHILHEKRTNFAVDRSWTWIKVGLIHLYHWMGQKNIWGPRAPLCAEAKLWILPFFSLGIFRNFAKISKNFKWRWGRPQRVLSSKNLEIRFFLEAKAMCEIGAKSMTCYFTRWSKFI